MGEAGDGREAIALAEELRPDVVCLDVRMPVMDGVAAAGPLAQRSKVLMLSYSEDEHLVTGAIRNGAAGYLVHGRFEPEELEGRIKAVARGEMVLSPAVTPAVFDVAAPRARALQRRATSSASARSPPASARSSTCSPAATRTARSRRSSSSPTRPSRTTSSRIYEKIGVHSRAEAIALWLGVRDS